PLVAVDDGWYGVRGPLPPSHGGKGPQPSLPADAAGPGRRRPTERHGTAHPRRQAALEPGVHGVTPPGRRASTRLARNSRVDPVPDSDTKLTRLGGRSWRRTGCRPSLTPGVLGSWA